MEIKKAFGQVLRRERIKREISQEALALDTGMARSYLFDLESGSKEPSVKTLFRVANGLGIRPTDFIAKIETRLK